MIACPHQMVADKEVPAHPCFTNGQGKAQSRRKIAHSCAKHWI